MIKYLLHNEIDFFKYDKCIDESSNSLIYGYSWYLNCITNNWDVLILNDYEVVMPLPKRKKYGINYIYLPVWVQQLGMFSMYKINEDLIQDFIYAIPNKFKLVDVLFNYNNKLTNKYINKRDNYILRLNDNYSILYSKFKKGRKSSVKLARKLHLIINKTDDFKSLIDLFKKNKGVNLNISKNDYELLDQLIFKAFSLQKAEIFEVLDNEDNLLGGAVFLLHKNRIIFLFSAVNQKGRKKQAISYLIDFVIQKYANRDLILDFEGSMINEIASFYKSFGAVVQPYFHLHKKSLF